MMLHLYGIFDRKANYFINVFPSQNDETALRSFDTLIHKSQNNLFADYPEDFELRYVCSVTEDQIFSIVDRKLSLEDSLNIVKTYFPTEFIQRGFKAVSEPSNLSVELDENLRPVVDKEAIL